MIRIIVLLFLCFPAGASSDLPGWIFKSPPEDSRSRFYLGSSSKAASHAEAIEAASKGAMERAIRENFGVEAQIASQSFETMSTSSVTSTYSERSKRVRIQGFETKESFVQKTPEGWSAWVLFAYAKDEIEAEKKRLALLGGSDTDIQFSEIGSKAGLAKGQLDIITDPDGATVFVDGKETLSKTPIRLTGVLEVGPHAVVIDHPDYEAISREILIQPGIKTTVKEILVPARGFLSVKTEPSGATVLMNGLVIGVSPVNNKEVPANRQIKLDFIHPEASKSSIEVTVARNESRQISETLRLKPAVLQVTVVPAHAEILINKVPRAGGWQTLPPGKYQILVQAKDHEPQTRQIELRGGERRIEQVRLNSLTELKRAELQRQKRLAHSPFMLDFGLAFSGPSHKGDLADDSIGFRFGIEKKFYGVVGLKASGISHSANSQEGDNANNTLPYTAGAKTWDMGGFSYMLSLPVYLSPYFYISPLAGSSSRTYKVKTREASYAITEQKFELKQSFYGGMAGFMVFGENWGGSLEGGPIKYGDDQTYKGSSSYLISLSALYRF